MPILNKITTLTSAAPKKNLLAFLQRNARIILTVGLFVTFWMLVYTFLVYKPGYAAKSVVIIKDSAITGRYIEPDHYSTQTTSSSSSNPVLNTMGILKSGAISDALWAYFQEKHPEELKKNRIITRKDWNSFYQDGSSFIKAKNQPGTDLIAIQFSWSNPVIAKEGLSLVLTAFQNASRDLNRVEQVTKTKFLEGQVKEIEDQLADIRKQKTSYQNENKTVNVNREGSDLASTRMDLGNKLSELESLARGKEDLSRRYQQLLGMNPEKALHASALGQNSSITKLQDELYRLHQQHSFLSSSLTENNPKVREIQAQIEQVKANLLSEQTRTMGSANQNEQAVVADGTRSELVRSMLTAHGEALDLRARASVIRNRLNQINADISGFPEKAEGLANIEQKETSVSQALDQLRQKVLEGRLKEEQTLSNVFIVDAPRLPEKAKFPTRNHLVVLSLFMGFGVGLAAAFAREQLGAGGNYSLPDWMAPLEQDDEAAPPNETDTEPTNSPIPEPVTASSASINHQYQPAASQQMGAGQSIQPARLLNPEPLSEKVEIPVIGSLFDSLVPVAGPMRHQQAAKKQEAQPTIRRDLTRPLNEAESPSNRPTPTSDAKLQEESPTHPIEQPTENLKSKEQNKPEAAPSPAVLEPDFQIQETHLTPPEAAIPARTVKVATTPSPITVAQAQAEHIAKTTLASNLAAEGVPVLHSAPIPDAAETAVVEVTAPPVKQAAPPTELPAALHEHSILNAPIQYKAPAQINVVAEVPASPPVEPEPTTGPNEPAPEPVSVQESATSQYEKQAKKMPLPRRLRGVPAFLLGPDGAKPPESMESEQPYTLIPRKSGQKQYLSADEDLMQEVAPLQAPPPQSQPKESHFLPFPEEMTEEVFKPRKPLIKPLWFGKKPDRHPEAYFGLRTGKKKQTEMPTSINRLMAAIQNHPAGYDN